MPEDLEEMSAYADKGPAVSRATVGRAAEEIERLQRRVGELESELVDAREAESAAVGAANVEHERDQLRREMGK